MLCTNHWITALNPVRYAERSKLQQSTQRTNAKQTDCSLPARNALQQAPQGGTKRIRIQEWYKTDTSVTEIKHSWTDTSVFTVNAQTVA
jgi:hypothetical protein